MESNCLDEFRWNLERLVRIKFLQGLPLKDLVSNYQLYFQESVNPKKIILDAEDWKEVFKHPKLQKHFQIKRIYGGQGIFLRQIKDEEEMQRLFRLTSYQKYVDSKNCTEFTPSDNIQQVREPLTNERSSQLTTIILGHEKNVNTEFSDTLNGSITDEAETSDRLVKDAALTLALHLLKIMPGRSVIEIAEHLHFLQESSGMTPQTPSAYYPDIILSSPKQSFSPGSSDITTTRSENDSDRTEVEPEPQPNKGRNLIVEIPVTDSKSQDPELGDDEDGLTDDPDFLIQDLNSFMDDNNSFDSLDSTLDEVILELHRSLFGDAYDETGDASQETDCIDEPSQMSDLTQQVERTNVSVAKELSLSSLDGGENNDVQETSHINGPDPEVTDYPKPSEKVNASVSTSNSADDLPSLSIVEVTNIRGTTNDLVKRKTKSSLTISDAPIPFPKVGMIRKYTGPTPSQRKTKRRRISINWHHCTVDWCSKKFKRETEWWKHLKAMHADDELMQ